MPGLSPSDIVSVDVVLTPQAAQTENFGSLMLLGASDVIDTNERMRKYSSITEIGDDFSTTDPEYLAADLFYSQKPQPTTLYIGRWGQSATAGRLHGAALSAAQQTLANFTVVSAGGMKITIDGTVKTLSDLDFSSQTNLNGVASVLTTALAGATVIWNANASRFEVKSPTTGTTSKVSVASAPDSGTDVSSLLGLTVTAGAKAIDGIAAESMASAVQTLMSKSNDWYGLSIAASNLEDTDVISVAGIIEAANPHRFFVATSQDANSMDPESTTDLGARLQALKYGHTAVQYSSSSSFAAVSLFARQASTDFKAQNSTITLMFKSEPGVTPETLTEMQAAALKAKNINVFVNYSNSTAIIQWGTVVSGQYIDSIVGVDWLKAQIETDVWNLLYQSSTKLPQSDAGVNQIVTTISGTMDGAVNNGLCAPGVWPYASVGPVKTGQTLPSGFFIYAPPVASQLTADRSARKSPTIQVIALLAGAIHSVPVVLNIGQ